MLSTKLQPWPPLIGSFSFSPTLAGYDLILFFVCFFQAGILKIQIVFNKIKDELISKRLMPLLILFMLALR